MRRATIDTVMRLARTSSLDDLETLIDQHITDPYENSQVFKMLTRADIDAAGDEDSFDEQAWLDALRFHLEDDEDDE